MNLWAQVVGTLVGGVMTFAGVVFQQWWASVREREARQQEIEARRTQQRSEFQIQTLLALQEATMKLQEATWQVRRVHSSEVMDEWHEKYDEDYVKTYVLMVRVQDEQIRTLVGTFRDHAYQAKIVGFEEALERAIDMNNAIDRANTRIGEVLRSLY